MMVTHPPGKPAAKASLNSRRVRGMRFKFCPVNIFGLKSDRTAHITPALEKPNFPMLIGSTVRDICSLIFYPPEEHTPISFGSSNEPLGRSLRRIASCPS